jgi:hypothetical protein
MLSIEDRILGRNIKKFGFEFRKKKIRFAYFEFRSLFSFLVGRLAGAGVPQAG